jgi:hypothetical protein
LGNPPLHGETRKFCSGTVVIAWIEIDAAGERSLLEPNLTDIDRHHQHFQDWPTVRTARVRATPGWHGNTVRRHMMRGQLRGSKSARDIHAIVVAAQHQVLPEEEILNEVVRLD